MKPHACDGTPDCFGCRVKTVTIGGSIAVADAKKRDEQFAADRAAYQRLRMNGVQPKHVDGSAELEAKAAEQIEIERHTIFSKPIRAEIKARTAELKEAGL